MRSSRKPGRISYEAWELHRNSLVVDLHTDSLIASRILGHDLSKRHRAPPGLTPWMLHADIPRLRHGGVDAVFLGIVTHPWPRNAYRRARRNIAFAHSMVEENDDSVVLATAPGDIETARREGRMAALLGVEGMHMLEGRLERIRDFYDAGVRYVTMAHFTSNRFAASSADTWKRTAPLTGPGVQAVGLMNELGMMIDVSHTHTEVITEVCRRSAHPVIVSHGACAALRPSFRNLTDEDIKNVAATGGVIGLIYCTNWLRKGRSTPGPDVVVDHADHIRRLVGVDHIALGSDWDGLIKTPNGMRDAADLPALTQAFLDRGYGGEEVQKILGMNFMRVFREVCGGSG